MRRSRRYRDKPIVSVDLETQNVTAQTIGDVPEIAFRRGVLTAEEQRQRSKHGWFNWYLNRSRLENPPTAQNFRQISWRRVF